MSKKEYVTPEILRVKLDAEQAVLGICSVTSTDNKNGTTSGASCIPAGCKQSNGTHNSDSGQSS